MTRSPFALNLGLVLRLSRWTRRRSRRWPAVRSLNRVEVILSEAPLEVRNGARFRVKRAASSVLAEGCDSNPRGTQMARAIFMSVLVLVTKWPS
jgi:hypothetical protein